MGDDRPVTYPLWLPRLCAAGFLTAAAGLLTIVLGGPVLVGLAAFIAGGVVAVLCLLRGQEILGDG